ncbi:hypothetical protein Tco_0163392 [Tanacetum coccineum]
MLALGNYVQWKSRIRRYIDTKPHNSELVHYCLQSLHKRLSMGLRKQFPVADGSSEKQLQRGLDNDLLLHISENSHHGYEVNELRAERLARTANHLHLLLQQQPVLHSSKHPTQNINIPPHSSHQIYQKKRNSKVLPFCSTYDPEPATVTEDEESQRKRKIDKSHGFHFSLNSRKSTNPLPTTTFEFIKHSRANQDYSPRYQRGMVYDKQRGQSLLLG